MSRWTFLLLCLLTAAAASALDLYVAPGGDDARDGRSPAAAVATLSHARDLLRAARQPAAGAPDTVHVLAGSYSLRESLVLGPEDSLSVWQAEGEVRLRGGVVLTGWQPAANGQSQCDLRAAGHTGLTFGQLFFAGRRLTLARTPNVDPTDPHGGQWAALADCDKGARQVFVYGKEIDPTRWSRPREARVCIFPGFDWAYDQIGVTGVLPESHKLVLAKPASYEFGLGDRYYVENVREELDAPGEWYLDRAANVVYLLPPEPLDRGDVVAPVVRDLVALRGASRVTLRGFTFEVCDGDAVSLQNSVDCQVTKAVVRNCAGWGVSVSGGHGCTVSGCDVYATGAGGISVNGGNRDTLVPGEHSADNNHIHHVAVTQRTYNCGINLSGVGNRATHNLIHDTPHAGVALSGNDNVFEFNVVHHTNLQSTDTGGLYYCSRDWTMRGNVIRYNLWHDLGGFGKHSSWQPVQGDRVGYEYPNFTWGIYLDDPTCGTTVYGNILYRVPICALHNHGGSDNTWENNVIVDAPALDAGMLTHDWGEYPQIIAKWRERTKAGSPYLARYPELAGNYSPDVPEAMTGVRFLHNIVYYTAAGTAWLRGATGAGDTQTLYRVTMRDADWGKNVWDYNVVSAPPELKLSVALHRQPKPGEKLTWQQWQAGGADQHSLLADPGFVDADRLDFRLKPDSPALQLGFKPIPVEQIGPYASPARASWPIVEQVWDVKPVKRWAVLPQFERLPARAVSPRGGLARTAGKLARGETVRVAYFGGGIHGAGGWRAAVLDQLRRQWPKAALEAIDGSITDAVRGSGFSVYRFAHDILARQPDLVLVDYASDDYQTAMPEVQKTIEGVVRQARRATSPPDLLFVYAFRDGYEQDYAEGKSPATVSGYERVAERYQIPAVDLAFAVAEQVRAGKLAVKDPAPAGVPVFAHNGVIPTGDGDKLYAAALSAGLKQVLAVAGGGEPPKLPPPLSAGNLERAGLLAITPQMLSGTWRELAADDPLRRDQARHFDTIWFTNTPGSKLTFQFHGTSAGLYWLMGPDTGRIRVTVDGKDQGTRQAVDPWSYYQRLGAVPLAEGLPDAVHTVVAELLPDMPDRSAPIAEAQRLKQYSAKAFEGVALRLGWIRLVGEAAP